MQNNHFDNTYYGSIVTILSAWIGWINTETEIRSVFMATSIISCVMSAVYTYVKIQKLRNKDENNLD